MRVAQMEMAFVLWLIDCWLVASHFHVQRLVSLQPSEHVTRTGCSRNVCLSHSRRSKIDRMRLTPKPVRATDRPCFVRHSTNRQRLCKQSYSFFFWACRQMDLNHKNRADTQVSRDWIDGHIDRYYWPLANRTTSKNQKSRHFHDVYFGVEHCVMLWSNIPAARPESFSISFAVNHPVAQLVVVMHVVHFIL